MPYRNSRNGLLLIFNLREVAKDQMRAVAKAPPMKATTIEWAFLFKKTENFPCESGPPVRTLIAPAI